MTAEEIGQVLGCYGPDAVTRLRARKDLRVSVVGKIGSEGRPKNLYRIEKLTEAQVVEGPYCCGYCAEVRRIKVDD